MYVVFGQKNILFVTLKNIMNVRKNQHNQTRKEIFFVKKMVASFFTFAFMMSGCSVYPEKEIPKTHPEYQAIHALIYNNVKDLEAENLEGYLQDIHTAEKEKEELKQMLMKMFEVDNVHVKIDSFRIVSLEKDKAVVHVEQTTISEKHPDINNKSLLEHKVKKVNNQWKIHETNILKQEKIQVKERGSNE